MLCHELIRPGSAFTENQRRPSFLKTYGRVFALFIFLLFIVATPTGVWASADSGGIAEILKTWWAWPIIFFLFSLTIGIFSVLGSVGSGVLYLLLSTALFPIHIDFVRTTSLLLALTSSLIASPGLLRRNLADIHLALPPALFSATGALLGSYLGLQLSTKALYLVLGITALSVAIFLAFSKHAGWPAPAKTYNRLAEIFGMSGLYKAGARSETMTWTAQKILPGLLCFFLTGLLTGVLGIETGWANIAVYNQIMGIPLKLAVGTGKFLVSFTNSSAAWVYFNRGCLIPMMAIPSILGLIVGSFAAIEMHSLLTNKLKIIHYITILMLIAAGIKVLFAGIVM